MSKFSKAFKKVTSNPINAIAPVFSLPAKAIEGVTGMDWKQQLMMGAGVGGAASMMGRGQAAGIPGLQGGPSLVNGAIAPGGGTGGFSAMSMFDGMGPSLLGGAASMFGANEAAKSQEKANQMNWDLAQQQMSFSAGQAQREMDFQERMSGSSYQRAVDDMRKAGINPMMAAGNGGASTPAGAMGQSASADMKAVPSVMQGALSSALDMVRTFATTRSAVARAQADEASVPNYHARTKESLANAQRTGAETTAQHTRNKFLKRQEEVEGLNSQSWYGQAWSKTLGFLDTIASRLPLVHSAVDLNRGGK